MNFFQSLSFTETDQLVALAPIVEEVGFHGAFVSDHLFHPERFESKYPYSEDGVPPFAADTEFPEPWSAISAMAAVTSKLVFSTAVYIAPLRHPLEVAGGDDQIRAQRQVGAASHAPAVHPGDHRFGAAPQAHELRHRPGDAP